MSASRAIREAAQLADAGTLTRERFDELMAEVGQDPARVEALYLIGDRLGFIEQPDDAVARALAHEQAGTLTLDAARSCLVQARDDDAAAQEVRTIAARVGWYEDPSDLEELLDEQVALEAKADWGTLATTLTELKAAPREDRPALVFKAMTLANGCPSAIRLAQRYFQAIAPEPPVDWVRLDAALREMKDVYQAERIKLTAAARGEVNGNELAQAYWLTVLARDGREARKRLKS